MGFLGCLHYIYHSDDMLVTKIDPLGKLAWMKRLPKKQYATSGKGEFLYKYIRELNNHYFLFFDSFLNAYAINDLRGEAIKSSILNTRDVKGTELFHCGAIRIVPIASNIIVFEAYKKNKEDVLIKVALP